jgi:hypothetical protein
MNLRIALALGAAVPALFALPGIAQDAKLSEDALAEKVINNTNPASFQVYGLTPAPKVVSDKAVQGGKALRIPVTGSGDPWSVGVNVPLLKPVKAGDRLVIAFYARLSKADAPTAKVTGQLQLASAPYTAIFGKGFDVTPEWQLLQVAGKADKDYAAEAVNAAYHVNTGKQVIDMGPVAVLDMSR